MSEHLSIRKTGDGSTTVYHQLLNETYHSVHGALTESRHVFIKHGVEFIKERTKNKSLHILEVGFGTGLNTALTLEYSHSHQTRIQFHSIEKYPLPESIWMELNFPGLDQSFLESVHQVPWGKPSQISSVFSLIKEERDILEMNFSPEHYDVIFFDAFAPGKQPELWDPSLFKKLYQSLVVGGVLVTYCAKGQFKRDLKAAGFIVESLSGPPGKREMVRGMRL